LSIKPESRMWHKLRDGTKDLGVFWTRLESWASPGVPDLHGIVDGKSFWIELKVHRLKSLKKIQLRPHQIAWQIRYATELGRVWNLVEQPSSGTVNLFHGSRAIELGAETEEKEDLIPDWSSPIKCDYEALLKYLLSS